MTLITFSKSTHIISLYYCQEQYILLIILKILLLSLKQTLLNSVLGVLGKHEKFCFYQFVNFIVFSSNPIDKFMIHITVYAFVTLILSYNLISSLLYFFFPSVWENFVPAAKELVLQASSLCDFFACFQFSQLKNVDSNT